MKKIIVPILLLISINSFAFDYHGIKSGMSEEEVQALTGCAKSTSCTNKEVGTDKVFNTTLGINPPNLRSVSFKFTSDDELWRITLNFYELSFAGGVAQKRALDELYSSVTKTSERVGSGSYSYNVDILAAMLIDDKLFNKSVDKIYEKTIDLY